jgi:hypothetical protein
MGLKFRGFNNFVISSSRRDSIRKSTFISGVGDIADVASALSETTSCMLVLALSETALNQNEIFRDRDIADVIKALMETSRRR